MGTGVMQGEMYQKICETFSIQAQDAKQYSPLTLDTEYRRDLDKGLPIDMPVNYYRDNDPSKGPLVRWRAHANLFFQNWLNYYVYQETPFDINEIK